MDNKEKLFDEGLEIMEIYNDALKQREHLYNQLTAVEKKMVDHRKRML